MIGGGEYALAKFQRAVGTIRQTRCLKHRRGGIDTDAKSAKTRHSRRQPRAERRRHGHQSL
jgi:hypothetical protein